MMAIATDMDCAMVTCSDTARRTTAAIVKAMIRWSRNAATMRELGPATS